MAKQITSLTDEQRGRFEEFVDKWVAVGRSTEPEDKETAEKALLESYKNADLEAPELTLWCNSVPASLHLLILIRRKGEDYDWKHKEIRELETIVEEMDFTESPKDDYTDEEKEFLRNIVGHYMYGQHEAHVMAFYDFNREVLGLKEETDKLCGVMNLSKHVGWWLGLDTIAILTRKPVKLHLDERGMLHHRSECSLLFKDGFGVACVHGVRVARRIVEHPETITAKEVLDEQNLELRRIMIDQYSGGDPEDPDNSNVAKFIVDAGAEVRHRDDWGTLYHLVLPGEDDEDIVMVKVVNSTANPDGSHKDYWLRVPPTIQTAKAAVAWTFDLDAEQYNPVQQS